VLFMDVIAAIRRRHLVSKESISSIARDLNLSRPTVRKHCRSQCEPLYRRHMQPTVMGQVERMRGELGEYAHGLKGHVRLLANTAAMAEHLPEALAAFLATNPNVDVNLGERPSIEVARAVAEGLADVGVAADHADFAGLEATHFGLTGWCSPCQLVIRSPVAGRSPLPRRWGATSWASRATARCISTWPGTRLGPAAGCGCGSGCAGWTPLAGWWRSARGSPWCPKQQHAGTAHWPWCAWRTRGQSAG